MELGGNLAQLLEQLAKCSEPALQAPKHLFTSHTLPTPRKIGFICKTEIMWVVLARDYVIKYLLTR